MLNSPGIKSLPNKKILDWSKFKAVEDDKINVTENFLFVPRTEENVGKGENAGYQHFLLFPECFPKRFSTGSVKVVIVLKRVKGIHLSWEDFHPLLNN